MRSNFEKGSSPTGKSSSGSESPKPGRRRFGSTADEIDVTKLNGMAENAINNATSSGSGGSTASNAELEAVKQEILREMRKEMAKMKQDIIEGMTGILILLLLGKVFWIEFNSHLRFVGLFGNKLVIRRE